ncbi:MAG: 50S ribosomal protein L6 [Dictyoglomus sp.]|nr:50S ribosomal protein L6 [Dictyoglomus sp.]MCX7941847.1 50S ribosomal protein L6 [Dictyoglomaceae bacterium]MDW8188051.1 50S ribosomal protein L6 [Dictyoglomus sp.]
MSRIGRKPIMIPEKVEVEFIGENSLRVKGPLGILEKSFHPLISIKAQDHQIIVERSDDEKFSKALHGLTRALINNMIVGVTQGFEKKLELQGTGYRARLQGNKLVMDLGFSHPVELEIPEGLSVNVEDNTKITIKGIDKEKVGQFAAYIRSIKPAEPYKGKGIRYLGEKIRQKAGKAGKK